jgi:hypothetical protein
LAAELEKVKVGSRLLEILEIGSTLVLLLEACETFSPATFVSDEARPIGSFGRKLRCGTGGVRGVVGQLDDGRDVARGADGRQFSPAAKKGNLWTGLAARRRNAAALTPVDRLVSPEISERPVDRWRSCDSFLPANAKRAALEDAYQLPAVCKKSGTRPAIK